MKSGPGQARRGSPCPPELVSEQEGPSSRPCLGDTGGAARGHPELGDGPPHRQESAVLPWPSEELTLGAGRAHLPFLSSHSRPLLPLLGTPSCHLAGFPRWPAFPTSSQSAAGLLPPPSVLPHLWLQVHTLIYCLPRAKAPGASVPRTPPPGHVPGPLGSTSSQRNPWLRLAKPAPPLPCGSGEGPITPTAIVCLFHPPAPPSQQQAQRIHPSVSLNSPFPSAPCHELGQGPCSRSPGQQQWQCHLLSQM